MINHTGIIHLLPTYLIAEPCNQDHVNKIADSMKTMGYCAFVPHIKYELADLNNFGDDLYSVVYGSEYVEAYKIAFPRQNMTCMLILEDHEFMVLDAIKSVSGVFPTTTNEVVVENKALDEPENKDDDQSDDVINEPKTKPQRKPSKAKSKKIIDWWKSRKSGGMEPTQEDLDAFLAYIDRLEDGVTYALICSFMMGDAGWTLIRVQKMIAWCKRHGLRQTLENVPAVGTKPPKQKKVTKKESYKFITLEDRLIAAQAKLSSAQQTYASLLNDLMSIEIKIYQDGELMDIATADDLQCYQYAKKKLRTAKSAVTRAKNACDNIVGWIDDRDALDLV